MWFLGILGIGVVIGFVRVLSTVMKSGTVIRRVEDRVERETRGDTRGL